MRLHQGRIVRVFDESERQFTQIHCPRIAIPRAGQFISAWTAGQDNLDLTSSLFPSEIREDGFCTGSITPGNWKPGTHIILRGPSGKGFSQVDGIQHLLLIAYDNSTYRLHPVIHEATKKHVDIAMFTNCSVHHLPRQVETYPISEAQDAVEWADLILIDLPVNDLDQLHSILGIQSGSRPPCQTQILINIDFPCVGIADCSVCAIKTKQAWRLACKDGPVFNFEDIEW